MKFENIKGCFLGMAVGDALGVPVEFKDRSFLQSFPVREMLGYGTWNQPPGTWSDDSSMAFCLAESLVNGYNPSDIAQKFVAWYKQGYWGAHHKLFDIGHTTRTALAKIQGGHEPVNAGEIGEHSNGNGSLMRIAPASIYFCNASDDLLYDRISEVSSITHGHIRSVLSCFIYSRYLISLFNGIDKIEALKITAKSVEAISKIKNISDDELKLFRRITTGDLTKAKENSISSSGYVVHTLEAALWCFVTTNSYSACVLKAVNLGEDTDTTACVAGALAGIYYGDGGIPVEWQTAIARKDDIIKLSDDFTAALKREIVYEIPDHISTH